MSTYPINEIRKEFPALNRMYNGMPVTYYDGPGGSQVNQHSIDAIVAYKTNGSANLNGPFPTSRETGDVVLETRKIVADLVGAKAQEVAFGQNATSLAFSIARSIGKDWGPGDEIVLTEMDHPANTDPWLTIANEKGVTVRWIEVDKDTCTLDVSDIESIINEQTRLVAVTAASNVTGTIPDVAFISRYAKEVGAIVVVDAVHAVPHFAIDRDELGADIVLCSAYKLFGPHVGIAVIREEIFESLDVYNVSPASPDAPGKLETGTQNFSGIAAVKPAIEFIERLGTGSTRPERLVMGYKRIGEHEAHIANIIREGLSTIKEVRVFQTPGNPRLTPTIAFFAEGIPAIDFCRRLAEEYAIFASAGHFYATRFVEKLGVLDEGGVVRIGIAPYSTAEEAEELVKAVKHIVSDVKVIK